MTKNRIFISFAAEDSWARDFLVGQARNEKSPFEFVDLSVKEPWDDSWKERCRTKIKGCDGLIAMISKKTYTASGARWEMKCAEEEDIPRLGIFIDSDDKGIVPPELAGCRTIEWTWPGIAAFLAKL
ncbi:MAG: hypothetical protein QOJ16_410 [Acidobacteriota bacterium]|jgi:hypothetical protein|nr:hypothetical protein [Acidobacteriota bacterium]